MKELDGVVFVLGYSIFLATFERYRSRSRSANNCCTHSQTGAGPLVEAIRGDDSAIAHVQRIQGCTSDQTHVHFPREIVLESCSFFSANQRDTIDDDDQDDGDDKGNDNDDNDNDNNDHTVVRSIAATIHDPTDRM